jgi:hypothetical protein
MDAPFSSPTTRRKFLKTFGGSLVVIPLVQVFGCSRDDPPPAAQAPRPADSPAAAPPSQPATDADKPRLSEDDPAAKALGYRHSTSDVDANAFPRHQADQMCSNCSHYQGADGESWGGCAIFPGNLVNAGGWCNTWVRKA